MIHTFALRIAAPALLLLALAGCATGGPTTIAAASGGWEDVEFHTGNYLYHPMPFIGP